MSALVFMLLSEWVPSDGAKDTPGFLIVCPIFSVPTLERWLQLHLTHLAG